eukprot:TRINITY_DN5648_c0_g2_i1.p1 TRINITY_DN5648_c0_g2~~TRINITY_DN5648_c0_g2_i1.p1  ORF type:complete len:427 (+),score=85.23 TRINITY_DN5648_c0_g2_i1:108-1283(+)
MNPLYFSLFVVLFISCVRADDPDMKRNVTQLIQARGYPVEDHSVLTPDGFILSVQRITGGRYTNGTTKGKPAVYLQHGLIDNSATWVYQEVVSESLGFILADAGYDVWMGNVRGNTYSLNNIHYTPKQTQFWDWSYDEMANYDLPSILNYILNTTKLSTISYVGHSQGTTMGFIAFENPQIAKFINVFVALGPVAHVNNCGSPIIQALSKLDDTAVYVLLGSKDFMPDDEVLKVLLPVVCEGDPSLCENMMGLVMGWDNSDINSTRLPVMMAHEPSGASVKDLVHWSQGVKKSLFQAYDYGIAGNIQHYNSSIPTQYNISSVKIPTALFYGGADLLADKTDVESYIVPFLPNLVYNRLITQFSHLDFVWGTHANQYVYNDIVTLLAKYNPV